MRPLRSPSKGAARGQRERRGLLVSRVWVQVTLLVVVCGFFILGLLAYRTYMAHPPVPKRVVDSQGRVLSPGRDIQKGQQVFLHNGLMEYGSAFGHGAYLGPDFTADYLRRSSDLVRRSYGGPASDSAGRRTIADLRKNRYDEPTKTLTLSSAQADAFRPARPAPTVGSSPTRRPCTACVPRRSTILLSCAN